MLSRRSQGNPFQRFELRVVLVLQPLQFFQSSKSCTTDITLVLGRCVVDESQVCNSFLCTFDFFGDGV